MSKKWGTLGLDGIKLKWMIRNHGNWKNQNPGGRFGATSWTALPIQPICPVFEVNGLDWHCFLAVSSKTAPQNFDFFSIAMFADYSFDVKNIDICKKWRACQQKQTFFDPLPPSSCPRSYWMTPWIFLDFHKVCQICQIYAEGWKHYFQSFSYLLQTFVAA